MRVDSSHFIILLILSLLKENKYSHNLLFIFDYFTHFTVVNFKIAYNKLYQIICLRFLY